VSDNQCQATTQDGSQCGNPAGKDGYCHIESHCEDPPKQGPANVSPDDPVQKPQDWDRVVDAACVFLVDGTVEEAATLSGYSERQIRRFRNKCSWWEEALNEAANDRLGELPRYCLRMLLSKAREGELDERLAWDIVQRMDGRVPDESSNVDVTSDGNTIDFVIQDSVVEPDGGDDEN
jgi:hypothetical protein